MNQIDLIDRPIFMIGMPRSGTTVLSEAISLHEELGWISNYVNRLPFFPWFALLDRIADNFSLGWILRGKKDQDKRFVSRLRRFLPHTDEAFTFWKHYCGEDFLWDYLINKSADANEKIRLIGCLRTVLTCQKKKRFFTKMTGPPRIHYLHSIFPNASFINVIRDPRATISSLLMVPFWQKKGGLENPWWKNGLPVEYIKEWHDAEKSSVALAAIQWKKIVELTWQEQALLKSDQYIEVRYEDFTESPHDILSEIFNRLGLLDSVQAHKYLSSVGKLTNMNFKFKNNLSQKEISIIEDITRKQANQVGYMFQL